MAVTGGRWTAQVAGLPCTVELGSAGDWIVTVAETSVSRHKDLSEAIVQAAAGLAGRVEANALATAVRTRARSRRALAADHR